MPDTWLARRPPRDPAAAFESWLRGRPADDRVVSVELLPESPYAGRDYAVRHADADWALRLLPGSYARLEEEVLAEAGVRVRVRSRQR